VTGYNLGNFSNLALAAAGAAPFASTFGNLAPRVGLAYEVSQKPRWGSVVRGGFGLFYDLATSQVGEMLYPYAYPFGAQSLLFGTAIGGTATFPLSSADAAPPPITSAGLSSPGSILSPSTLIFSCPTRLSGMLHWSKNWAGNKAFPRRTSVPLEGGSYRLQSSLRPVRAWPMRP